ncbi:hypothetical protein O181_076690 [Austropuccinia psidii MF-1]|uniref:Uncharacterized protein n=1 Tax=Austropuccinia psidii MF-1 TaxID=1389203 RepID=A0A9Q3FGQ5_9BASI|nr:hypothetical protein [Austropuccinia psidii MF-1]
MSNSKRYKLHSEGSNRHLYEPVKTVLHILQRQGFGNVATNQPRSDGHLEHPEKFLKDEEIVRYFNGLNPLSSKPQIKKKEETKEEAPSQPTPPRREAEHELYKYIKDIKDKALTINYDVSIDNLTEKLSKLSISVEQFEEKTSSHQKLLVTPTDINYIQRAQIDIYMSQ